MKKLAILILILVAFENVFAIYKIYQSILHPYKYSELIIVESEHYNLNASLVASLINVESSYNARAVSKKGAVGLGQILPSTAYYINIFYSLNDTNIDLFDPQTNIKYTCLYLRYLFDKFSDQKAVIASYNAGETKVRSWLTLDPQLNNIPYIETKNYIKKINDNLRFYSKVY